VVYYATKHSRQGAQRRGRSFLDSSLPTGPTMRKLKEWMMLKGLETLSAGEGAVGLGSFSPSSSSSLRYPA